MFEFDMDEDLMKLGTGYEIEKPWNDDVVGEYFVFDDMIPLGRSYEVPIINLSPVGSRGDSHGRAVRFSEAQKSLLKMWIDANGPRATSAQVEKLKKITGLSSRQIRVYLSNYRMRQKCK